MRCLGVFVLCAVFFEALVCVRSLAGDREPFVAGFDRFYSKSSADSFTTGQLLLTELSCTACHEAGNGLKPLAGPDLRAAGSRLQASWIRNYLNSTSEVKPGGSMPHVLHQVPEHERAEAIEAIAQFISTNEVVEPKIVASGANPVMYEFWLKGEFDRGRELYHSIGCIACHAIDKDYQPHKTNLSDLERKIANLDLEPDELKAMGLVLPKPVRPVPVSQISDKYTLRSLSMFLLSPHLVRPSGRMPNFKLQPHEAADIAAYLFGNSTDAGPSTTRSSEPVAANPKREELVTRGKKYFEALRCSNCHSRPDVPARMAKPLVALDVSGPLRGCLVDEPKGPIYKLSEDQKVALKNCIFDLQDGITAPVASGLTMTMLQLNCFACHERGGLGGIGPTQMSYFENTQRIDVGDEGRLPPPLDHVGRKLDKAWIQKVLDGKGDVRPHLKARMPTFSQHAQSLAAAFVAADQKHSTDAKPQNKFPEASQSELEAGRELFDSGCVQCHAFRGESLPGTIGIDLTDVHSRLNPEWFRAFLLDPAQLKKNTRMPTFFPNGKSSSPQILRGDVEKQIASIWNYLKAKEQPLPSKLELSQSQNFELKPLDKPILLRTFMEEKSAGTHAIAVGLPEQLHFAFDAKGLRLGEVWKGRFLNAQSTWFDRFAPPAIPLGNSRIQFPIDPFMEQQSDGSFKAVPANESRFHGYRLDDKGIPTFRYAIGDFDIEDRIEAMADVGLIRRIAVKPINTVSVSSNRSIWLMLVNHAIELDSRGVCTTQSNLRIEIVRAERQLKKQGESSDLIIAISPSDAERQREMELRYRW